MNDQKRLDRTLGRLGQLHPKSIDLSLGRIEALLARLGHPERHLPPTVHVAGTNGKGSTVAYLRAAYAAAGHRVHVYTSPHLVDFNERIVLAGTQIEDGPLCDLLEECEAANEGAPITYFEITTTAALLGFSRKPADLLLLEVGLGGRLDTTNVVSDVALSVITPISMDHMGFLGDTLEKIAFEKAGILRPGVPAVIAHQDARVMAVIEAQAEAVAAPLLRRGELWQIAPDGDGLVFRWRDVEEHLPMPALLGAHQIDNAGAALAALRALAERHPSLNGDRAAALTKARWPARMQRLTHGPLVAMAPDGWEVWLDGGHNEDAGRAVAALVAQWRAAVPEKPIQLVFGALSNRDPAAYLQHFRGVADKVWAVSIPGDHETHGADQVAIAAASAGLSTQAVDSLEAALAGAVGGADGPGIVLICGSLYLAGEVLRENG